MASADIVFLTDLNGSMLCRAIDCFGSGNCSVIRTIDDLSVVSGRTLFSFSTSVIVPSTILSRYSGRAYNLHAASPEYPGRDPHHWAVYDGACQYGATLHVMTAKVDSGPIVDVELFNVSPRIPPSALLARANEAAFRILERSGPKLVAGQMLGELAGRKWGLQKRTRTDFLEMCRISNAISKKEFERRFRAFDGDKHNNLTFEFYGHVFRIEK